MAYINDATLLEQERQRVALRNILINKGMTPASDATTAELIPMVDRLVKDTFLKDYFGKTMTEFVNDDVVFLKEAAFDGFKSLKKVSSRSITGLSGSGYHFNGCSALEVVDLPELQNIEGYYQFSNCTALKVLYLPNVTRSGDYYFCYGNTALEKYITPKAGRTNMMFYNCNNLKIIDWRTDYIQDNGTGYQLLEAMILRGDLVPSLSSASIFSNDNTVFYIKQSLVTTMKQETNWSALPNIENRVIALEGTQYEPEDWLEDTDEYKLLFGESEVEE